MKNLKYIFISWSVMMIIGCNAAYTTHPIGEKPVKLEADDWEGTWMHNDGILFTKVTDSEKGILKVGWIEEDEMKLETFDVHILESGEWMFVNIEIKDDPDQVRYLWGKIRKNDREVIGWVPDIEECRRLVNQGKLPGKVNGDGDVFFDDLTPEQMDILMSKTEYRIYDEEEPTAAIRIDR